MRAYLPSDKSWFFLVVALLETIINTKNIIKIKNLSRNKANAPLSVV